MQDVIIEGSPIVFRKKEFGVYYSNERNILLVSENGDLNIVDNVSKLSYEDRSTLIDVLGEGHDMMIYLYIKSDNKSSYIVDDKIDMTSLLKMSFYNIRLSVSGKRSLY